MLLSSDTFKGKVAFITGTSFGIGKSTALAFAKHGAKVLCADWEDDVETVSSIKKLGGEAVFIKMDVSNESDVKAAIKKAIEAFGRIDFAFNNAGIEGQPSILHEGTNENWDRTLGINLTGTWYCMKYQVEQMLKQGGGCIVNNASVAGLVGFQGTAAYVASKHAVVGLTKSAALDYAKQNIRINVVCPGVIRTPMVDRFTGQNKAVEEQFASMKPIGRLGEPDEVAQAVLWLCSDAATFIIGHALPVDGGWVVH